jgi:hypothetical protein
MKQNNIKRKNTDTIEVKIHKYVVYAIYGILIFSFLGYFNGCSSNRENTKLRKELTGMKMEIDSLHKVVNNIPTNTMTQEEFEESLEENMWRTLEMEELSDRKRISITELKVKHKENGK